MGKDVQEVIRDAPFGRKALFLGMQFTGLAGLASIVVACMAPPISLAVAGAGIALFAASFAGQVVFLAKESKRQEREEAFSSRGYSSKAGRPSRPSNTMMQQKTAERPVQKQVSKAQRTDDSKQKTQSVRFSAGQLREIQRSREQRYLER